MQEGRGRLWLALIVAVVSLIGYFGASEYNPITAKNQHVRLSPDEEIVLGLKSEPQMEAQYGGPSRNRAGQAKVEEVGSRIVGRTEAGKSPYPLPSHPPA